MLLNNGLRIEKVTTTGLTTLESQSVLFKSWKDVYPFIGETHIEEISPEMVRAILEPIWQTKPSTAKKVKTYLRQIFQWGYRIKKEEGQRKSSTDGRNLRRPNGASAKKQERKTKLCVLSCKGYSSANVRDSFL